MTRPEPRARVRRATKLATTFAFLLAVTAPAAFTLGAESDPAHTFDIPRETAEKSLKQFSQQSGFDVLFGAEEVQGVRTNALSGEHVPAQAMKQLLAGTGLIAKLDEKTGAFTISHDPNAYGAAPTNGSRPDQAPSSETGPRSVPSPLTDGGGETLHLNPFEVMSTASNSYAALNSNALTAFNLPLDRLPATADVLDQAFLDDVDAQTVEGAIAAYDAGSTYQLSGQSVGAYQQNQPGDHGPTGASFYVRGFAIQSVMTNGLQLNFGNYGQTNWNSTSNYDIDRIEIIDGPQALLFTGGGPGGAINVVTKQADFDRPSFGELTFRVDQYGSKEAAFDLGVSQGNLAVRAVFDSETNDSRRVNIGDRMKAGYLQLADRWGNTTFRLTLQQSVDSRPDPVYFTLTSTGDPAYSQSNSDHLEYLMATNQAGGILNGNLGWQNAQSLASVWAADNAVMENGSIEADSTWTSWLATKIAVGGANFNDDQEGGGTMTFYSPGASANPLKGDWTMGLSGNTLEDIYRPHINKSMNASVLLTNDLFGGRAKSQTSLEGDYAGNLNENAADSNYYQADANWNVVVNPAVATNLGRTPIPAQAWSVSNGPILYALFNPGVQRVTYQGANYVRQLITPFSSTASAYGVGQSRKWNSGYSIVNHTQWMGGKLDTMIGLRYDHSKTQTANADATEMRKPDASVGAVYHVLSWLAPYVTVSDLWAPGGARTLDGSIAPMSHAVNEEAGLKFSQDQGRLSGSISYYRSLATNEATALPGLTGDVAPNGLNGTIPGGNSANISADILSYGLTAAITASPTENWRMRLSAAWTGGKFESGATVNQQYNDQFYEDKSGDVTYADGTIVDVPPTFNSKQYTVPAGTAGAVPLTAAALSTPGSQYYAQPQPVTGAILKTSNGGLVLLNGASATHGAILTGATGLPMAAYQLNPALSGVDPLGVIDAVEPGQQTRGYPAYSVNFTNVYEFSSGWLKGFRFGGTVTANWTYLFTYYNASAASVVNIVPQEFWLPNRAQFDLVAGYTRKFRRVTWSTQLNVNNLFNHYDVLLYPGPTTGFSTPANVTANFYGEPRYWSLTTRFRF